MANAKRKEKIKWLNTLCFFKDEDGELLFSTLEDADFCARMSAGTIIDLDKAEIVADYGEGE